MECQICLQPLDSQNSYHLRCNHMFCKDCFSSYIQNIISEGPEQIFKTCPAENCQVRLGKDQFKLFLTEQQYQKYENYIINIVLQNSTIHLICTSPHCQLLISNQNNCNMLNNHINIRCKCGNEFCNLCKEDAHKPLSCQRYKEWNLLFGGKNSEAMTRIWLQNNTKPCPKCKIAITKNEGCMHIQCRNCGHHFCWLCLNPFDIDKNHNDYYNCNLYQADKNKYEVQQTSQKEKEDLRKFDWFSSRFIEQMKSQKMSVKEMEEKVEIAYSVLGDTIHYNTFKNAYRIVVECRKAVSYCYPLGYFMSDEKLDLFRILQSSLEDTLEKLHSNLIHDKLTLYLDDEHTQFIQYIETLGRDSQNIYKCISNILHELENDEEIYVQQKKELEQQPQMMRQESKKEKQFWQVDILCINCNQKNSTTDFGLCEECFNQQYTEQTGQNFNLQGNQQIQQNMELEGEINNIDNIYNNQNNLTEDQQIMLLQEQTLLRMQSSDLRREISEKGREEEVKEQIQQTQNLIQQKISEIQNVIEPKGNFVQTKIRIQDISLKQKFALDQKISLIYDYVFIQDIEFESTLRKFDLIYEKQILNKEKYIKEYFQENDMALINVKEYGD